MMFKNKGLLNDRFLVIVTFEGFFNENIIKSKLRFWLTQTFATLELTES